MTANRVEYSTAFSLFCWMALLEFTVARQLLGMTFRLRLDLFSLYSKEIWASPYSTKLPTRFM